MILTSHPTIFPPWRKSVNKIVGVKQQKSSLFEPRYHGVSLEDFSGMQTIFSFLSAAAAFFVYFFVL